MNTKSIQENSYTNQLSNEDANNYEEEERIRIIDEKIIQEIYKKLTQYQKFKMKLYLTIHNSEYSYIVFFIFILAYF